MADVNKTLLRVLSSRSVETSDLSDLWNQVRNACLSQEESNSLESLEDIEEQVKDESIFSVCTCASDVEKFIGRVFTWRFGWTESHQSGNRAAIKQISKKQQEINRLLDLFIDWFRSHSISKKLINALTACIVNAKDKPIVRNQTCIYLLEWYRFQLEENCDLDNLRSEFAAVKGSVLLVLQDVWSAIRKACVTRLGPLIQCLSLSQLQHLYADLIHICRDGDKPWQAHEGAIMGVHYIIKQFQWTSLIGEHEDSFGGSSSSFCLVFGREELSSMPEFISSTLKDSVFPLLKHEQLTVREYAIKTYTCYLSKSHLHVAVSCFEEILHQLRVGTSLDSPSHSNTETTFQDPYAAESLLGICVYLIKHVPPRKLSNLRALYFSTFRLYLAHPASTVRQATSDIFKFIVARDSSNLETMKFVLQGLCCDWVPDMELLYTPQDDQPPPLPPRMSISAANLQDADLASTWEYREGRLLAYELIMQFLIKNHWIYTFGTSYLSNEAVFYTPDPSKSRRRSSLSDALAFTQAQAAKSQQLEENTFHERSGSFSSGKPTSIPKKIKSDVPLSSSVGRNNFMLNRLATVTGTACPSTHVTSKHFSYYNTEDSSDSNDHVMMGSAQSLIMACQREELSKTTAALSPRTVDKLTSNITDPCLSNSVAGQQPDVKLESLTTLLERVLHENIECLADERWELRRMGSQLLPCLVEVIRWFDMKIVEDIWDNQLKADTSLLSYAACLALKYSVAHAARLQHILKNPPASWQDHALCQRLILRIVDPLRLKLGGWSQLVHMILQERSVVDKLSVVSIETLVLIHTHFELTTGQKYAQLNRIITTVKQVFCKAHPETDLAKNLAEEHYIFRKKFRSPTSGFLSCCVRPDNKESGIAKQVEKHLLHEMLHSLPHFLKMADAGNTHELLPVLCCNLGMYLENDDLCKSLIESIHKLVTQCKKKMAGVAEKNDGSNPVAGSCHLAVEQLGDILALKSLDQHTLKQICDVFLSVAQTISVSLYLPSLVTKLSPKLSTGKSKPVSRGMPRTNTEVNLLLQAPNPPLAPMLNGEQSTSEDEDEQQIDKAPIQESQTLNASMNSTGSGAVHVTMNGGSDEDSASDWDSWDEEEDDEQGDSGFSEAVKGFLVQLKASSGADVFARVVNQLPGPEQEVISDLLP